MMDSPHKANPSKARPHGKDGEDSGYCLSHSAWMDNDSQNVPKQDSREQSKASSHHHHHRHSGDSSMNNHAISQHPLSPQYNGLRSSLPPPSPSPPPNPFPYHHPELPYPSFGEATSQGSPAAEEADEIELERNDDSTTAAMLVQIPTGMQLTSHQIKILQKAERLPPIRTSTLSELDLNHIMRNINLRIDVNFDRELHFQPIAGEKGHEKRKLAEVYWEAIALEISVHSYQSTSRKQKSVDSWGHKRATSSSVGAFEPRLPAMLETLKDVVSSLVPERDQQSVMQNLDVPFLLQQVHKGVLDMVNLTKWLATLLKTHCAPMRDPWADRMVAEISEGCETGNIYKMVEGLRTMFGTLESMKLDVANHQIRAFRVILIDDTVRFLQSDLKKRIAANAIDIQQARRWYLNLGHQPLSKSPYLQHELRGSYAPITPLFIGLFSFLTPFEHPKRLEDIFEFEADRLWFIRADVQDLIGLKICSRVFEMVAKEQGRHRHNPYYQQAKAALPSRICSILDNCSDGMSSGFNSRSVNINSPTTNHKWKNNIGLVTLEIAQCICSLGGYSKSNTFPDRKTLEYVEKCLDSFFSSPTGQFREFNLSVQGELEEATFGYVKRYLTMTPLEISEDQRPREYPESTKYAYPQRLLPDVDGIAKRLAHVGVLHWRVWAPVLYLRDGPGITFAPGSNISTMYATE
ncbi:cAMP-mediated signaling protein Sok1, putative [Trichophyton verrucosum HKI 0517]|uniref:cAMP-mediated signaling protein Sok1, putative n=1 Tax=Trichophyton verrucosum (strain HKI 0517) TaxID=663202 RepID=D4D8X8_TRIVH|nr:cAMP-mediated signaling protein Sok1, putative [Trichophyton verrucosum HKI 0517]EFE41737.1 cAMP-mediated signaling protein Sok1, putative [Trichophyton verrucosum HKI 0517]